MKYKQELSRQLALDYCCNAEDILDNRNHFNVYEQRDGRRRFEEQDDCVLKVIVVNEKLIFTGKKEIVNICKEKYETCSGVWFMDVARFRELDTILKPYGYQLKTAHPFFLPEKSENRRSDGQKSACQDALSGKENRAFEIKKYNHDEIQQCLSVSENIERGHRKIGKSSLLWNQHVKSCITTGCCKRRI